MCHQGGSATDCEGGCSGEGREAGRAGRAGEPPLASRPAPLRPWPHTYRLRKQETLDALSRKKATWSLLMGIGQPRNCLVSCSNLGSAVISKTLLLLQFVLLLLTPLDLELKLDRQDTLRWVKATHMVSVELVSEF